MYHNDHPTTQVTAAVAALLDVPRTASTSLGTVCFADGDTTMYAVDDSVINAHEKPQANQLRDFQLYCEREMARSFPARAASLPAAPSQRSGSIGHHDDLLSWLPRSRSSISGGGGGSQQQQQQRQHTGDAGANTSQHEKNINQVVVSPQTAAFIMQANTAISHGFWGVRFHDKRLERAFGDWINGLLCRVDLMGAVLSLIILSTGGVVQQAPWRSLVLLLGTPATVAMLVLLRRAWYVCMVAH